MSDDSLADFYGPAEYGWSEQRMETRQRVREFCEGDPAMSGWAVQYEAALRKSHFLIREGKGDSQEHDALCDEMDEPWENMTVEEQDQMRLLSAQLYVDDPIDE